MKLLLVGETTIDRIAHTSHLSLNASATYIDGSEVHFGGRAANVATALAAFHFRPTLVSAVGQDFRDSGYELHLMQAGVPVSHLMRVAGQSPQVIVVAAGVDTRMYFFPEILAHCREAYVKHVEKVANARWELVYATAWIADANRAALSGSSAKYRVYCPGHEVTRHSPSEMESCLAAATAVILNQDEARVLVHRLRLRSIREIVDGTRGSLDSCIVTLGSSGSTIHSREGSTTVPACAALSQVDPTGAGDRYTAGLLAGLLHGANVVEACQVGSSAASFAVEGAGAQHGELALERVAERCQDTYGSVPPWLHRLNART